MTQETLKTLYEAKDFPVFQNRMYPSPEAARNCPKGDIRLVEDQLTGLIYNAAFRSELVEYDIHYQNEQAVSPLFRQHLEQVATIVEGTLGREQLIEVGCGKAYFLQLLVDKGFDITGFDPTYEGDSPRVRKDYFREGAGLRAKGLILRHVLEHIADPVGFLGLLKAANGGQGKIYIEVPCFDWICKHRAWFDIFYEHANYFRLSDFKRMFRHIERCGSFFGDQYLYVVADLASLQTPTYDPSDAVDFPADFLSRLILAEQSRAEQSRAEQSRAPVCVWGGASKGVIFALLRERAGYPVSTVIDVNPAKQGQYLAGTGLKVLAPTVAMQMLPPGSTIFVMNSNYLDEIKTMSNNAYQYIGVDQ